jgi:hypothetical protein
MDHALSLATANAEPVLGSHDRRSTALPDASLGTERIIDGQRRVYYYGYWVKAYDAPADTLLAKKRLIEALTRRLFSHVEHGLNVPGQRLGDARRAFEAETDPQRRRIKGAMLAGALFNRATDIFTKLVEIQALGIKVDPDNALMRECGHHLEEALDLAGMVLHRSGEEGLDELWGEPFKAFAFPIEDFYKSRYVKIAQTMEAIDRICDELIETFATTPSFAGVAELVHPFAFAAKTKSETLSTDPEVFEVWTSFVVAGEKLSAFQPTTSRDAGRAELQRSADGVELIRRAKDLVFDVTRARVPMPKTTRELVEAMERFRQARAESASFGAATPSGNTLTVVGR